MRNTPTISGAQFSQATVSTFAATNGQALVTTRMASDTDGDCYLWYAYDGWNAIRLYRADDTGTIAFTQLGANFTPTAVAGDILRLESDGSTHTCKKNGVSQGTRTDATYATGQPGLAVGWAVAETDSEMDDWSGGDLAGGAVAKAHPALMAGPAAWCP